MSTSPPSPVHPRLGGIVLAAGRSTRMGRPKPLLDLGDRSFLEACISVLHQGGCVEVVVVLPADGDRAAEAGARAAGAIVVRNENTGSQQVDSLRLGLDGLEGREQSARTGPPLAGALVLPVDHPLVDARTIRALLVESAAAPGAIIRPVHDGRPGHPTLFPRSIWPALRDPELLRGARSVVESPETPTLDLEVDDAGVVADIDTPEAYRRYVGGEP